MQSETPRSYSPQPQLFLIEESIGTIELFPTVWGALEDFTKSDLEITTGCIEEVNRS